MKYDNIFVRLRGGSPLPPISAKRKLIFRLLLPKLRLPPKRDCKGCYPLQIMSFRPLFPQKQNSPPFLLNFLLTLYVNNDNIVTYNNVKDRGAFFISIRSLTGGCRKSCGERGKCRSCAYIAVCAAGRTVNSSATVIVVHKLCYDGGLSAYLYVTEAVYLSGGRFCRRFFNVKNVFI